MQPVAHLGEERLRIGERRRGGSSRPGRRGADEESADRQSTGKG
jgi:hypothetical protein